MMIDENRLLEEINKLPYTNGNYDKENANTGFINGVQTAYKLITNLIKEQPKVNEWIPVTERLPEERQVVPVWYKYKYFNQLKFSMAYIVNGKWVDRFDDNEVIEVLAWYELPKYEEKENVE